MENKEFFVKQLQTLIDKYNELINGSRFIDLSDVNYPELVILTTRSFASIERISGKHSSYYGQATKISDTKMDVGWKLQAMIGCVGALRDDIKADFLKPMNEIIRSDIFNDFLEMSEHLFHSGYKDASAVIAGSTLESHLKKLCEKFSIEITYLDKHSKEQMRNSDSLNSDLVKENVYSKLIQKQITAWLGIRNSAAHGNYSDYGNEEVKLMIMGIQNFIISNSA